MKGSNVLCKREVPLQQTTALPTPSKTMRTLRVRCLLELLSPVVTDRPLDTSDCSRPEPWAHSQDGGLPLQCATALQVSIRRDLPQEEEQAQTKFYKSSWLLSDEGRWRRVQGENRGENRGFKVRSSSPSERARQESPISRKKSKQAAHERHADCLLSFVACASNDFGSKLF